MRAARASFTRNDENEAERGGLAPFRGAEEGLSLLRCTLKRCLSPQWEHVVRFAPAAGRALRARLRNTQNESPQWEHVVRLRQQHVARCARDFDSALQPLTQNDGDRHRFSVHRLSARDSPERLETEPVPCAQARSANEPAYFSTQASARRRRGLLRRGRRSARGSRCCRARNRLCTTAPSRLELWQSRPNRGGRASRVPARR